MLAYVARRAAHAVPTLLGVALATFTLFHAFAPDPAVMALGQHATPQAVEQLRRLWGLDRPLVEQFMTFLAQALSGDFGNSFFTGESISAGLGRGALVSLSVTAPPFVLGGVLNIALALHCARWRDGWLDRGVRAGATAAMSVSALVYVVVTQYVLAYQLGWFPITGYEGGWRAATYLALPWIILLLLTMGPDVRLYRSILLDETQADYVRTARALGASESRVLWRSVLPNAWIPIITNNVTSIPFLLLGTFVIERFFSIPGLGNLTVDALGRGDLPVLKAVTMWGAAALVLFNLLNDLLCAAADPRVRLR